MVDTGDVTPEAMTYAGVATCAERCHAGGNDLRALRADRVEYSDARQGVVLRARHVMLGAVTDLRAPLSSLRGKMTRRAQKALCSILGNPQRFKHGD